MNRVKIRATNIIRCWIWANMHHEKQFPVFCGVFCGMSFGSVLTAPNDVLKDYKKANGLDKGLFKSNLDFDPDNGKELDLFIQYLTVDELFSVLIEKINHQINQLIERFYKPYKIGTRSWYIDLDDYDCPPLWLLLLFKAKYSNDAIWVFSEKQAIIFLQVLKRIDSIYHHLERTNIGDIPF